MLLMFRLLPVLCVVAAAVAYVVHVESGQAHVFRNVAPMLVVVLLAALALWRGGGRWDGAGWRWPLATAGFAIPTVGLSLYLHYGYATDMNGMVSDAVFPEELFRYLPLYTMVAGGIGFAIGWIVGRNV